MKWICGLVALALSACVQKREPSVSPKSLGEKILGVTTSNFETGSLVGIDLLSLSFNLTFAPVFSDAVPKKIAGYRDIFVLNRLGSDSIQRIDRATGKTLSQISVGRASNPQDVEKCGEAVFISLLDKPFLLVWDIDEGSQKGQVDLRGLSDSDGLPEATRMRTFNDELWVQVQRLDRKAGFTPSDSSMIAVVNPQQREVITQISMLGKNPVSAFKSGIDGNWLVANAGFVGQNAQLDGGIEKIDITRKRSRGYLVTEADLGGDLVDFECLSEEACLAIISRPETELVLFDPETGIKLNTLWRSSGYHLRQILRDLDSGFVYVADGDPRNPMIQVWSESELSLKKELSWPLELPPYQMEFF